MIKTKVDLGFRWALVSCKNIPLKYQLSIDRYYSLIGQVIKLKIIKINQ
jgi:hypothetical protein